MTEESAEREGTIEDRELAEVTDRITKAREAREAIERQRAARERLAALEAEAEGEERALKDAELLEQLDEKHEGRGRKWDIVHTGQGLVAVKKPHHVTFNKFQDKGVFTVAALLQLVRPSLLHPTLSAFEHMLEEEPAILVRVANRCTELAGVAQNETAGK